VKFKARASGANPSSEAKGTLSIDQAYMMPAKSIVTTPTASISQREFIDFELFIFIKNLS
jgi:hypothetical protein